LRQPVDKMPSEVTDHDRERAEDTVQELERLGGVSGALDPDRSGCCNLFNKLGLRHGRAAVLGSSGPA
jgi:hypothetical protein